jgi:hypothetical protein
VIFDVLCCMSSHLHKIYKPSAKLLFTLANLLFFTSTVWSQDILFLWENHQPQKVKIVKIASDGILYKKWPANTQDTVEFKLAEQIEKLIMEDGTTYRFADGEVYASQFNKVNNTWMLKVHPFSPLFSQVAFDLEKTLYKNYSLELGAGIIGAGSEYDNLTANGYFVRLGYKITFPPVIKIQTKYYHPLHGYYIKPELAFVNYSRSKTYILDETVSAFSVIKRDITSYALLCNFGKQWIWENYMAFDMYAGIGVGFSSEKITENTNGDIPDNSGMEYYQYAYFGGRSGIPVVFNTGIRVSVHYSTLSKKKKDTKR